MSNFIVGNVEKIFIPHGENSLSKTGAKTGK